MNSHKRRRESLYGLIAIKLIPKCGFQTLPRPRFGMWTISTRSRRANSTRRRKTFSATKWTTLPRQSVWPSVRAVPTAKAAFWNAREVPIEARRRTRQTRWRHRRNATTIYDGKSTLKRPPILTPKELVQNLLRIEMVYIYDFLLSDLCEVWNSIEDGVP